MDYYTKTVPGKLPHNRERVSDPHWACSHREQKHGMVKVGFNLRVKFLRGKRH